MTELSKHSKPILAGVLTVLGTALGWKGAMLLIWAAVMALDYLTGSAAACKGGRWSSGAAREGLWHKGGMLAVVLVAALGDWALVLMAGHLPLGFGWPGLLLPLVLAWYILTELGSILENALSMGARVPKWLRKALKAGTGLVEAAGEKALEGRDEI